MKKIFVFILIFAVLFSSCAKEEAEIIEENEIIEESVSSESEVQEEIPFGEEFPAEDGMDMPAAMPGEDEGIILG